MALEEADIAKITEIVNGALDARQAKDTDKNDDKDKDVDAATIKADEPAQAPHPARSVHSHRARSHRYRSR